MSIQGAGNDQYNPWMTCIVRSAGMLEQFMLPEFSSAGQARAFWKSNDEHKFSTRRFFMFFGAFAFLIHGILDLSAGGDQTQALLILRMFCVVVMLNISVAFCVVPKRLNIGSDTYIILYLLSPALTIVAMTVIAQDGTAANTYPFGLVVLLAYGGAVINPGSVNLLKLCVGCFAIYLMTTPFAAISQDALIVNAFFLVVGISAIAIGSIARERLERMQFSTTSELRELNEDLQTSRQEAVYARDAAVRAGAAQTDLIASVSHELRTPLNAIMGFSELMLREIDGPIMQRTYAQYVHDIHKSGKGLSVIVDDLLDMQRLSTGKLKLFHKRFSVNAMVRHSMMICQLEAEKADVQVKFMPSPMAIECFGDSTRMSQVITNLLLNAISYSPSGGEVAIEQGMMGTGEYRISITDHGIGIADEDLARIQEPFQQVVGKATVANDNGGLGLGLSIVLGILKQTGGRFEMKSTIGSGTSCHVFLPSKDVFLDESLPRLEELERITPNPRATLVYSRGRTTQP